MTISATITGVTPARPLAELRLNAAAVGRLNWQPRVCPAPMPCIASRRGDVLEVVFVTGPGMGYRGNAGHDPASWSLNGCTRYRYHLEATEDENVVIGRRIK